MSMFFFLNGNFQHNTKNLQVAYFNINIHSKITLISKTFQLIFNLNFKSVEFKVLSKLFKAICNIFFGAYHQQVGQWSSICQEGLVTQKMRQQRLSAFFDIIIVHSYSQRALQLFVYFILQPHGEKREYNYSSLSKPY